MKTSRMVRIGRTWWLPVLFLLATAVTVKAETSGDYVYTINPNGTIRIDEYTGPGGAVTVPSNIVSQTVVGIGRYAFSASTNLTSVTIPANVTSIGEEAFMSCTKLTSVTIGNSVVSIGDLAFWSCTSLTGITIPNSVTSIGMDAFWSCTSLASVTIGNSVTSIGDAAFYECTSLTSITIPNSVTNIGDGAFVRCTSLTAITVDAGNAAYSSLAGGLFNTSQTTLIQYPGGKVGSYTIPAGVTNIGDGAFYWCTSLTGVTIPASVTSIGDDGFHFCTSLTGITIPNNVTSIGMDAFNNCTSLRSVTIPNSITSIRGWAFISCSSLSSVTISASVTNIEDSAFASCTNLTGVYCRGNAPGGSTNVFYNDDNVIVYYVAGTTGWGPTFSGRPTAQWNNALPEPIIRANGAVGTVTVDYPAAVSVTVEMDAGSYVGTPVDWWVVACAGSSWYYKDSVAGWTQEDNVLNWYPVYQGGLLNLPSTEVLNITGLGAGSYTFYFAVDYPMDGILNLDGPILYDSVNVTVQ